MDIIELTLKKKGSPGIPISININHIVYYREYTCDSKESLTALFTPSKMLVVYEDIKKINSLIFKTKELCLQPITELT